jgi:hypothetical protein
MKEKIEVTEGGRSVNSIRKLYIANNTLHFMDIMQFASVLALVFASFMRG